MRGGFVAALLGVLLPGTVGILLASIVHGVYGKRTGAVLMAIAGIAVSVIAMLTISWKELL